jgi:hypothetical protein
VARVRQFEGSLASHQFLGTGSFATSQSLAAARALQYEKQAGV